MSATSTAPLHHTSSFSSFLLLVYHFLLSLLVTSLLLDVSLLLVSLLLHVSLLVVISLLLHLSNTRLAAMSLKPGCGWRHTQL